MLMKPPRRASALEALETLGDKTITQEVLPVLDRGGVFRSSSDQEMNASQVIDLLLSNEDYWLRALAARSIPELDLKEFIPALRRLESDSAVLVKQAAADALAQMEDGAAMKTLKTISTLERILLLREVPMFSRLSPRDLEQVAEIAEERLFADQSLICREGEPGDTLFIIVNGKVKVMKQVDTHETLLAVRTDGEFVGEMAILESARVPPRCKQMERFVSWRSKGERSRPFFWTVRKWQFPFCGTYQRGCAI